MCMLKLQVLNGNPYNRKCDVYSFGICLWEIYCCDMPYPDLSFSEVTSAVVRQVKSLMFSISWSSKRNTTGDVAKHMKNLEHRKRRVYMTPSCID